MTVIRTTIESVFKCDKCEAEATASVNPFFTVGVSLAAMPLSEAQEIHLCRGCVPLLSVPVIEEFVASTVERG